MNDNDLLSKTALFLSFACLGLMGWVTFSYFDRMNQLEGRAAWVASRERELSNKITEWIITSKRMLAEAITARQDLEKVEASFKEFQRSN